MKKIIKRLVIYGILIIVILGLWGASFYFGYLKGFEQGKKVPEKVIVKEVKNIDEGKEERIDFSIFWQAWKKVKDNFVDIDEISDQELVYGAISGLLQSLKDSHSVFFPPSDAKTFNEDIEGEFGGIGAEIGIRKNQLVIIAPLKNTPAEKAGLKPMDKILEVDGESTQGITLYEAVKKIRGEKGTKVILTIGRDEWEKPKKIEIIRDIIQIPTLDWEMKEDGIAYFKLYNFYAKAPLLFYQAAIKTAFSSPKGILIDLRNNPGGYLNAAVNLAGWFLDKDELVVSEQFRSGEKIDFKSQGNGFFKDFPVVILVNEGSASASEILAGALRISNGAKLVGKKTFGKGTVQELHQLKDGSMIKITVAYWLLADGTKIEGNGLEPDYEVDLTEEDEENNRDPQLEKAIKILKEMIEKNQKSKSKN